MKYLSLIWYGIWRKRGRTILILFQIMVAFVLFGLLQGLKSGIDSSIAKLRADIYLVQRDAGVRPLPMAHMSRVQSVPGVKDVTYESFLMGTYQDPKNRVMAIATDIKSALRVIPGVVVSPEVTDAMMRTKTGTVVSNDLARKYGWKAGDHIALKTPGVARKDGASAWEFDVLGTFDPGDQSLSSEFMIFNYDYLDEARADLNGTVQFFYVVVKDPKRAQPVITAIDEAFKNSPDETRTESLRETAQAQLQSIGDLGFIVRAVVGAVLFALLFSVGAMMTQSLRERTAELAVLKTLGFKDQQIFLLLVVEVLLVCVVAALVGLSVASLIIPLAAKKINLDLVMPSYVFVAGIAIALLVAGVTAAVPAWRGMRLQIVDALAGR